MLIEVSSRICLNPVPICWSGQTLGWLPLSYVKGVPEKLLISVQRHITQVWKQPLGHVGAVFKSSGYQLSFGPKKSRIIQKHQKKDIHP